MTGHDVLDALAAICMLLGAVLAVSGTLGIVRFPDVLSRLHAATKPQVLGLRLMLAAVGMRIPSWGTISTLVLKSRPALPRCRFPGAHPPGCCAHDRPGGLPHQACEAGASVPR
jgi:hypothetical protein